MEGGYIVYRKKSGLRLVVLSIIVCLLAIQSPLLASKAASPASSVGAANFYEIKPNPYLVSLGVKGYQQTTDYTCGPAAVMSLMAWYNMLEDAEVNHDTEMRIAREMGTGDMNSPNPGTNHEQIAQWLKKNGFKVVMDENGTLDLIRENLNKGIPVIVDWIDWGGHWVVATGYYAESESPKKGVDTIFFADPATHWTSTNNPHGITSFNAWRFNDMWFDTQYLKPGQLAKKVYIIATPIQR